MGVLDNELITLASDLIKFRSTKDNYVEIKKCLEYIKKYYSNTKIIIKEFEYNKKPSLMISFKDKPHYELLLNGHIDVIEADPEQYLPKVNGDKLYGRGAIDMKSGVAAFMLLMKNLSKQKNPPDVALMIVSDEEIGGLDGTGPLSEKYSANLVIASEPTYAKSPKHLNIIVAEKGVLWLKLKARGVACHGSRPWLGDNAIVSLMDSYRILKKMFPDTTSKNRWKHTINLGKIVGGDSPNRVPDYAEMMIDIRYVESTNSEKLISQIKKVLPKNITIEIIENATMLLNKDFVMIKKLQSSVAKTTGNKVELANEPTGSDLRFYSDKSIPAVIFGPLGENYHGKDEFIYIYSLKLYYLALSNFVNENYK
jgi:succinyl-diaminopimelate desuccinylase